MIHNRIITREKLDIFNNEQHFLIFKADFEEALDAIFHLTDLQKQNTNYLRGKPQYFFSQQISDYVDTTSGGDFITNWTSEPWLKDPNNSNNASNRKRLLIRVPMNIENTVFFEFEIAIANTGYCYGGIRAGMVTPTKNKTSLFSNGAYNTDYSQYYGTFENDILNVPATSENWLLNYRIIVSKNTAWIGDFYLNSATYSIPAFLYPQLYSEVRQLIFGTVYSQEDGQEHPSIVHCWYGNNGGENHQDRDGETYVFDGYAAFLVNQLMTKTKNNLIWSTAGYNSYYSYNYHYMKAYSPTIFSLIPIHDTEGNYMTNVFYKFLGSTTFGIVEVKNSNGSQMFLSCPGVCIKLEEEEE